MNNTEPNTTPPTIEQLKSTVKFANDVLSTYVKRTMYYKELALEMVKLFKAIWRTNKIL